MIDFEQLRAERESLGDKIEGKHILQSSALI